MDLKELLKDDAAVKNATRLLIIIGSFSLAGLALVYLIFIGADTGQFIHLITFILGSLFTTVQKYAWGKNE